MYKTNRPNLTIKIVINILVIYVDEIAYIL